MWWWRAVLVCTYVVRVSKGGKKNYYYEWGEKHLSLGTHKLGACKTMSNNNSKKIPCLSKMITCLSLLGPSPFTLILIWLELKKSDAPLIKDYLFFLVWHCHREMQIKSCSLVYILFLGSEICKKTRDLLRSSLGLRMSLKECVNDF